MFWHLLRDNVKYDKEKKENQVNFNMVRLVLHYLHNMRLIHLLFTNLRHAPSTSKGRNFRWRDPSKAFAAILLSEGGYRQLKEAGLILPSPQTAKSFREKYCKDNHISFGYGRDLIQANCKSAVNLWKHELKALGWSDEQIKAHHFYVQVAFDETSVGPGAVFDSRSGRIIGLYTPDSADRCVFDCDEVMWATL